MIQILPVYVPGFLVPFIMREMDGVTVTDQTEDYTNISIEPNSILGMFLRRRIKPDYKVKNYRMVIYSKKISACRAFSIDILEFQSSAMFKVDLSFEELEDLYKFLKHTFMISFNFYVKGYLKRHFGNDHWQKNKKGVRGAINEFIDEYDLLEYGYSVNQLSRLFYGYKKKGCLINFQNNVQVNQKGISFL